jgi:hypothetical protein
MSHVSCGFTRVVTGVAFLITFCMLMPNVAQAGCSVRAEDPYVARTGRSAIVAVGVRGNDCKERKLLYVRLREHRRFWPDKTLAEVRFTVTNARLRTHYLCKGGAGERVVFTEAWVQGDTKSKSRYKEIDACG